jgi:hypothetical protein
MSFRLESDQKEELKKVTKKLGFPRPTDFVRHAIEMLLEHVRFGHDLVWPLRFERKKSENKRPF